MTNESTHTMQLVFNAIECALIVYDHTNHTYKLNAPAKKLLAITDTREQLDHTTLKQVIFFDANTHITLGINTLFNLQTPASVLLKKPHKVKILHITSNRLNNNLSMLTLKLAKKGNDDQYNFDKIISEISTKLIDIQSDNIEQQINFALKAIGTVCHADRSYLLKFNIEKQTLTNTHEWVNAGIVSYKDRLQNVPTNALPYFFKLMQANSHFQVNDINKMLPAASAEQHEFKAQDIKSLLCVGLYANNELVGFIGCDCVNEQRQWSDLDLIRIKLVGEIINNALKNIDYKKKLHQAQQQLIKANIKLKGLANTDGLTNIANRRCFDTTLHSELKRCARQNKPISLIMCDIDFFKHYNDFYGHQKGDDVLKIVAKALKKLCKREGDLAARYGGEEFALILPLIDAEHCGEFARLVQQKIASLNIAHEYSPIASSLTLSFGCYSCIPNATTQAEEMINNADKALYQAKNTNRNQINVYTT